MQQQRGGPTEQQREMIGALDDAVEHLAWELDPDEYRGLSTCGFARIVGIDGRSSFVRRVKSLAESGNRHVTETRNGDYRIEVGGVELSLTDTSGYSLSIVSYPDQWDMGPNTQRLDFQERAHRLVLDRLQEWGLLAGARVQGRVD